MFNSRAKGLNYIFRYLCAILEYCYWYIDVIFDHEAFSLCHVCGKDVPFIESF
jgi:hypothetical protein